MNFDKIYQLKNQIKKKKQKLKNEKDIKKKQVLRLKISIDEINIKIERLK